MRMMFFLAWSPPCPLSVFALSGGFVSTSGLQVAVDMQKKITARREQIDSLQGKIQHLEETMEKLQQVKNLMYRCLINQVWFTLKLGELRKNNNVGCNDQSAKKTRKKMT